MNAEQARDGSDVRSPAILRSMSIRWKLLLAFLLLAIGTVAVAVAAVLLQMSAAERAALVEAQHVAAEIGIDEVQSINPERLQRFVTSLGNLFNHDLFIVDRDSRVVASTNPKMLGNRYHSDFIDAAISTGRTQAFIGPDASDPILARQVAAPIPSRPGDLEPSTRGAVIFEYTQVYETARDEAERSAVLTGIAALILLLLGCVFAVRFTDSLVRPLKELEEATALIAADDYSARVTARSGDEVGRLALAFNSMADDLSHSRNAMRQQNEALQDALAQQKIAGERIEYMAFHDSLTNLPNRSNFSHALTQAIARAERYEHPFGLFFIDLDRFKQINDTLGHAAGDALLMEVAQRLRSTLRTGDTVARLGGDEFVILVEAVKDDAHAVTVARKVLSVVAKPFSLPEQELRVTASIGISRYVRDGVDEETLMKHADIAMYQAKDSGKNTYAFYSAALNTNSFERLALESSLRKAMERGELLLHYQPKKDFRTGGIAGMEVLLRWQHPDLGTVSPAQFIPIAEETGLIVPIGRWVLLTACMQTVQWHADGLDNLTVAVNLSSRQFADDDLLTDIADILQKSGMDGRFLELEITESMIMHDVKRGQQTLQAFKAMGIRIAVDDFGTGYSSLSTLKQFPIDTLKIDRSFIRDLATDAEDRGLTEAIIQLAKTLKLHLVAEGVETVEQSEFLQERGCDELQGYLFSKPIPAIEFRQFVDRHRAAMAGAPNRIAT